MVLAVADHYQARIAHPAAGQVRRHRLGAALRQRLVVLDAADRVGVPRHLHHGLVVLHQGAADLVEHRVEARIQVGAVAGEGDAARHVEGDVVILAHHLDPGAGHLGAQRRLLPVLVVADGAAGHAADRGADEGVLELVAPGQKTDHRADAGADAGPGTGLVVVGAGGRLLHRDAGAAGRRAAAHLHLCGSFSCRVVLLLKNRQAQCSPRPRPRRRSQGGDGR